MGARASLKGGRFMDSGHQGLDSWLYNLTFSSHFHFPFQGYLTQTSTVDSVAVRSAILVHSTWSLKFFSPKMERYWICTDLRMDMKSCGSEGAGRVVGRRRRGWGVNLNKSCHWIILFNNINLSALYWHFTHSGWTKTSLIAIFFQSRLWLLCVGQSH